MIIPGTLQVHGPGPDTSFKIQLLHNPQTVKALLPLLPLESFLLHVVVAGETIYHPVPVPSMALEGTNMVPRRRGTVYLNTTSQSICFCYGLVSESTPVNEFARVVEGDLPNLEKLGRIVYDQAIARKVPTIVRVVIDREDARALSIPAIAKANDDQRPWQIVKDSIDSHSARLRLPHEPDEIQRIRLGAVKTLAGREKSPFQGTVFLQGFLSTLGPHIFSRLLLLSKEPDMTLNLMVRQTRIFLVDIFNHFDFLGDLGLETVANLGREYADSLTSLASLDDYRLLTDAMRTLIQLYYRWLHLVFPWYLKDQFRSRTPEEADASPKLRQYE